MTKFLMLVLYLTLRLLPFNLFFFHCFDQYLSVQFLCFRCFWQHLDPEATKGSLVFIYLFKQRLYLLWKERKCQTCFLQVIS